MRLSQERQAGALDSFAHDGERFFRDIDKLVKGWNHWAAVVGLSDYENYINGRIKLLFEYVCGGRSNNSNLASVDVTRAPNNVPFVLAEADVDEPSRKVGDLAPDAFAGKPSVISYWGQKSVFFRAVHHIDEIEKFVPSRFSIGLEADDSVEKTLAYPVGQSVLYGFNKPVRAFAERELDGALFLWGGGEGRHDFPVGMVESHSEAMDSFSADKSRAVYDGFVLFGERGALAGLCVCFEDVGERAIFVEQFVKLRDVFRSSINL